MLLKVASNGTPPLFFLKLHRPVWIACIFGGENDPAICYTPRASGFAEGRREEGDGRGWRCRGGETTERAGDEGSWLAAFSSAVPKHR